MDARALEILSAGLRHMRDAEHLESSAPPARSLDQAYHLAGFAPECARKATLSQRAYDKAIGHGVSERSEVALLCALAMDPSAHRYDLLDWRTRYPSLAEWSEHARYEATGTRASSAVTSLLREARDVVDRIVLALWADGAIPGSFAW